MTSESVYSVLCHGHVSARDAYAQLAKTPRAHMISDPLGVHPLIAIINTAGRATLHF